MKGNKSTGDDDISARFFKSAGPYITDSIGKICNCRIKTGRFPELPLFIKKILEMIFLITDPYQFYQ